MTSSWWFLEVVVSRLHFLRRLVAYPYYRTLAIAAALAMFLAPAAAQAAVTINKSFSPASMTSTGTSTLTVTLGNTATANATGATFTDTLPSGLTIASPSNGATTCGGTVSATAGGSSVGLSGGTINANGGTCTVTVAVTATTIGNYTNTIPVGGLTTSQGSNGSAASATLAVTAQQPVTGSWALTSYNGGGGNLKGNGPPITYTLTLNDPNTIALTNVGTTLTLQQPYLAFATPSNVSTTCGGTATPNTGTGTLTLSGGTIPANGSCTITFNVIAAQPNSPFYGGVSVTLPAGNITDAQGITNSVAINLGIGLQTGVTIGKSFSPNPIISGGTSTMTITINYLNATNPLSPINLTDTFPAGLTVASMPNASTTCGGSLTAVAGSGSVQLSGGSEPAVPATSGGYSTCTITVGVTGTNSGTSCTSPNVTLTNSIPAGNFAGVNYNAASAGLVVTPAQPLCGSNKSISNYYYAGSLIDVAGSIQTVTVTLDNPLSTPNVVTTLTDNLTTMGAGFTVAASPAPTTTCAGGVVSAPVGGTSFTMTGGTIPASNGTAPGTCTISVPVNFPLSAANVGGATNTIPAGAIVTSQGSNTFPISYGVGIYTPLQMHKSFTPSQGNPGVVSQLGILIINGNGFTSGPALDPLTNISDSDTLPAGMVIATPSALSTTCTGTVTAPAGGNTIAFSGINLNAGQNCSITLNVQVPPGTPTGNLTNTIPSNSVTTDQGITNGGYPCGGGGFCGGPSATLTVTNANVTINKTFTPANVPIGTASQLAIQFVNTNPGNITLTNAALIDQLPNGMTIANPANASFASSGCAGTVSAAPGATSVALSGAQINAGTICTLKVNVITNAVGSLINTIPASSLASAQAVTNSQPSTATLVVSGSADVSIAKSDGVTQVAAGTSTTYTITVGNGGPNNVSGVVVDDTTPAGVTFTSWTCAATGGSACGAASGSGSIHDTILIDVGTTVTYTVTAQIPINYIQADGSSLANTATVTLPGAVSDPNPVNNTSTDTDTVVPGVVLALTKTDNSATYTPGTAATYVITAQNTGPANATQVNITDSLPPGVMLNGTVTCTPAGIAACGTVSGAAGQTQFSASGAVLPSGAGNALNFSVPVKFPSNLTASTVTNVVSAIDVPSGVTGTASDSDTIVASADVSIVKSGPASVLAGAPVQYTLTISNAGPSDAGGAMFDDPIPASIVGVTASCGNTSGGAVCPASVTVAGNTVGGTTTALPAGGSMKITINGTASATNGAAITNTATVAPPSGTTDPNTANNTSSVTTAITPVIQITKTADTSQLVPGGTVHYTITVSNPGPAAASSVLVTDPLAAGIANQTWTCAAAGGATCAASGSGAINDTITTLPPSGSAVYTVTATISSTPPTNVSNTAAATVPNNAAVCATADTPAPCSATASLPPVPQVGITKTVDVNKVTAGGTIHYTITVSNTGVMSANNTPVSDPIPTGIASQTWMCAASGGATCTASGTGAISDTIATFPPGSFVKYTVTAIVSNTPPAAITNTATSAPTGGALCTPGNTAPPCSATATVSSNPQITLAKSADTSSLIPGGTVHYTVTVTNSGAVGANGTTVSDPIPTGIAAQTWICAANAGATCAASGSGAISDTIATFPPGSFATYTVTATVSANPPGTVSNTVTADPPTGGACMPGNTAPPCSATATGAPLPQVSVQKSTSATTLTPSGTIVYTIVASNTGSVDASGTVVSDPIAAGIASQSWTCTAGGGAACPSASGSGALNETIATLPVGGSVTYTLTAMVSATPPASVVNTVSATPPNGGVCTPGNTASPCTSSAPVPPVPEVSVHKSASATTLTPGGTIVYTIVASNTGSVDASGTQVSDPIPTGIASQVWTCAASGGAVCSNANGSGALSQTIATLPVGGAVTYTVTATVSANPPASVINTASATPPGGGVCAPNNAAPPCNSSVTLSPVAQVSVQKSTPATTLTPSGTIVYTIVASNTGSASAAGTVVSDPMPTGIASQTWNCVASGGATCPNPSGSGPLNQTIATFPAGGSVTYTVTATVSANPPATVVNTASATPPNGGVCTPGNTASPCTSSATVPPVPQVSVRKSTTSTTLTPSGTVIYSIVVSNTGAVSAPGTTVSDPQPAGIASQTWTCAASGGAVCPNASGSGALSQTIATFPPGSSVTYAVTATVSANPPATVVNTASATPPNGGVCTQGNTAAPCQSSAAVPPVPQVSVTKTANTATLDPGGAIVYTVTVVNTGTVAANNTLVSDPIAAGLTAYATTCAASGGAVCPNGAGPNSGALNETIATLPVGAGVVYTITATVGTAPSGPVTNTVSVTPPGSGLCAPNNTSPPCTAATTSSPPNIFNPPFISKAVTAVDAQTLLWTIVVDNNQNSSAQNLEVRDPLPVTTAFVSGTVTCIAYGSSTLSRCAFDATNNRIVADALMQSDFGTANPATAPNRLSITFQARFVGSPVAVTNIASACWDPQNSTTNVTACTQAVQGSARYTPPTPPAPPVPTPIDARWMLWLMAVMLGCSVIRGLPGRK